MYELTEIEARQRLSAFGARMLASRMFSRARREVGGWSFHPVAVPAQVQLVGDQPFVVADNGLVAQLPEECSPDQILARLELDYLSAELEI